MGREERSCSSITSEWNKVPEERGVNLTTKREVSQTGVSLWWQVAIFTFVCAFLAIRKPDSITHPQLWAEDGHVWVADAYNRGCWNSLLRAQDGYLQTFPRLAASVAVLAPLSLVPLLLNVVAIAVHALPIGLLLSSVSSAWGSICFRAFMAAVYLALPNCVEVSYGVTESQWLLALSAFLLTVGSMPQNIPGRAFQVVILLLCGLTGPFCIVMAPIAALLARCHQDWWRWILAGILGALCIAQVWALLILDPLGRPHRVLGASIPLFMRILGGQVYLGTLLGSNGLYAHLGYLFFVCAAIGGSAIVMLCFIEAGIEMKLFIIFSAILFIASLVSSAGRLPYKVSVWELFAVAPGVRYWFFPSLAFAWSLLWCLRSRLPVLKVISTCLLMVMCIGIVHDFRQFAFRDLHYAAYVRKFESAPVGTTMSIPINPEGWNMQLVKHPPRL